MTSREEIERLLGQTGRTLEGLPKLYSSPEAEAAITVAGDTRIQIGNMLLHQNNVIFLLVDALRDALAKAPKWISVEDSKKPRHGQESLCICAMENDPKHEWDYQMVLKWYAYGSNGLVDRPHFQHEGCEGMTVTHWMPLPEPPKEGE